jgi:SSS family solute:Na+ symporter
MVSGLFVPVLGGLFWKNPKPMAAFWAMLLGGGTTISLVAFDLKMPLDLEPNLFGILVSLFTFVVLHFLLPEKFQKNGRDQNLD